MAKISNFMYGMVLSIGLFAILSLVLGQLFVNYNVALPGKYNQTISQFTNTTAISSYVKEQKTATLAEESGQKSNPLSEAFDILGYWFERGYSALKASRNIIELFTTLVDLGINSISEFIGIAAEPLKFIIISLVVVAIVIGVILSTLVKREV